jgi:hypothetical protein
MKSPTFGLLGALLAGTVVIPIARTQTNHVGQSNYTFRFNTGISGVFLNTMTFASEHPLNLGACTTNEKVNGPLFCSVNCNNDSVCLLEVSGPPGSSVNDVMEKVTETPVTAASPSPTSSPNSANPFSLRADSELGDWFQGSSEDASSVDRRVEAYNTVARSRTH